MKNTITILFLIFLLSPIIPIYSIPSAPAQTIQTSTENHNTTTQIIPMIIIGTIENKTYNNGVMSFNAITIYRFTPLSPQEYRGFYQGTMRIKGLIGLATNHFILGYCEYYPRGW